MKKNSICKIIVSGLLCGCSFDGAWLKQVCGNKPWSVRMAESEWCVVPNLGNWIFRPV